MLIGSCQAQRSSHDQYHERLNPRQPHELAQASLHCSQPICDKHRKSDSRQEQIAIVNQIAGPECTAVEYRKYGDNYPRASKTKRSSVRPVPDSSYRQPQCCDRETNSHEREHEIPESGALNVGSVVELAESDGPYKQPHVTPQQRRNRE